MYVRAILLAILGTACGQEPLIDPAMASFVNDYTEDGRTVDIASMGFAGPAQAESMRDVGHIARCSPGGVVEIEPHRWDREDVNGQRLAVMVVLEACRDGVVRGVRADGEK